MAQGTLVFVPGASANSRYVVQAAEPGDTANAVVLGTAVIMAGDAVDRPAPSEDNVGCLYLAEDTGSGTLYRSDGSNWVQVAASVDTSLGGSDDFLAYLGFW
jgi:hypothetical protein